MPIICSRHEGGALLHQKRAFAGRLRLEQAIGLVRLVESPAEIGPRWINVLRVTLAKSGFPLSAGMTNNHMILRDSFRVGL